MTEEKRKESSADDIISHRSACVKEVKCVLMSPAVSKFEKSPAVLEKNAGRKINEEPEILLSSSDEFGIIRWENHVQGIPGLG